MEHKNMPLRLSNNRGILYRPAKKIAQKLAYMQFLLYLCSRFGFKHKES